MFQLTLKYLLSIIGSINTCVPNLSLSLLHTLLLFEQFALLLPLLTYCVSDLGLHLLFLLPLFYYNHSACLSSVFVCISMQYCHLNTSLFIVYLNHIFYLFFFFSSCRRVLALILKLSSLSSSFSSFLFFFFSSSPTTLSSFSSLLR